MKKFIINQYISGLLMASAVLFTVASCVEEEFPVDKSHERMFRPYTITATDVAATSAKVTWAVIKGTDKYIVEVSKDSLVFENIVKTIEYNAADIPSGSTTVGVTISGLIGVTTYSVRVKVTSKTGIPDSEYAKVTFKTKGEQILNAVADGDKGFDWAKISWTTEAEVTHLTLFADGTEVVLNISDEEKAAGYKVLQGLASGTNYTVEIYNTDSNKRGTISFVTYSIELPDSELVVFLDASDVFEQTTFDTLTVSSVVFVLPQGSIYTRDAGITLKNNSSITFFGEPGATKPIMAFNGITLPGVAGSIRFENIDLTGFQYVDGQETATKRNYIFNQSAATETAEVTFENCIVRNFVNTPFRLQSSNSITIEKLVFNNCIVTDVGDNGTNGTYAFINTNVATGKINNIEITNSTFYKVGYGIILHNSAPSESVKIENCTFNNVVGDGRYFIDYNAQTAGTFVFLNNILGKTKSPAGTARGIRISSGSVTVSPTSYMTSDFTITSNAIGGISSYNNASTDLFADPAAGNFAFKDQNFEGINTAGDPRWRP